MPTGGPRGAPLPLLVDLLVQGIYGRAQGLEPADELVHAVFDALAPARLLARRAPLLGEDEPRGDGEQEALRDRVRAVLDRTAHRVSQGLVSGEAHVFSMSGRTALGSWPSRAYRVRISARCMRCASPTHRSRNRGCLRARRSGGARVDGLWTYCFACVFRLVLMGFAIVSPAAS